MAPYWRLGVALAIGLLVGVERERRREDGRESAGSRTFALIALAGGVAAALDPVVVAAGALGVGALLAVGYARTAPADAGMTTEAAAGLCYLLGAYAYAEPRVAASVAVVVTGLLAAKHRLHRFVRDVITDEELEDALRFAAGAVVVLPLLPNRPVGPYGVLNPARIWLLVLLLTGVGWAGHLAVRLVGVRRGLALVGLAGGFVSATATTAALARRAKVTPQRRAAALAGAALASVATVLQILLLVAVTDTGLLASTAVPLLAAATLLAGQTGPLLRRDAGADEGGVDLGRAVRFLPAIGLAALLTTVLLGARWGADIAGPAGAVVVAALAGLADVHAATLAVATLHAADGLDTGTALVALAAGLVTNTGTKCLLAVVGGGRDFARRFVLRVAVPLLAAAAALALRGL